MGVYKLPHAPSAGLGLAHGGVGLTCGGGDRGDLCHPAVQLGAEWPMATCRLPTTLSAQHESNQ